MVADIRELNRGTVLAELLCRRGASRRDIAAATGISPTTVTRAVESLLADGVVVEGPQLAAGTRGRRAVPLHLAATRGHVVGVDLGASNTRLIVADLAGNPVACRQVPTDRAATPDGLAQQVRREAMALAGHAWASVEWVGIGLPGAVRLADGSISNAPNLPQIEDPAFVTTLRQILDHPVMFDNDVNFALLGELHFGAACEATTAAMLTIGTGLGSALAIRREVLRGERGLVGEFGLLPAGPLGMPLENLVTGPGILRRAAEARLTMTSPDELFVADPSPQVARLRTQFDQAVLIVLAALTVACEPQCVVVGGRVGASLMAHAERYRRALLAMLQQAPAIVPAALGDYCGAAGAVAACLQACYRQMGADEARLVDLPVGGTLTSAAIARYTDPRR